MNRVTLDEDAWRGILNRHPRPAGKKQPRDGLDLYRLVAAPEGQRFVVGQVGQSLDGRVATTAGDARDISGQHGLRHLHRLRALCDAVVVGVGTVLHDDPQLTVRHCAGPSPARIVVDPSGRAPDEAQIFRDDGIRRLTVQAVGKQRPAGVEIVSLPKAEGAIAPLAIIEALAERGFHRLLIEGGARTLGYFLTGGLLDRLHISISPLIIGDGPTGLALPPVPLLRDCLRPKIEVYDLGGDFIVDCAFAEGTAKRS